MVVWVFKVKGFYGVCMEDICVVVDMSVGVVFWYFVDKCEMIDVIIVVEVECYM